MNYDKGYSAFCSYIKNKRVSLIGLGVSNLPLVSFLYGCGASEVSVRDLKKNESDPSVTEAVKSGAKVILGEDYLKSLNEDLILRSPGIRPDIAPFLAAKENGSTVSCDTEMFLRFCPCKTFAVTGSDGKTTTTTLISKILAESGKTVFLGGNIGKSMLPMLKDIKSENDVAVMELSSFQLMECSYSPDVAVITNLSENHLDWHKDMEEYLDAKKNILRHQNSKGIAVLNLDNIHTKKCSVNGTKRYFSTTFSENTCGVFLNGNKIVYRNGEKETTILYAQDILLPGKHNVENYMAAIAATTDHVTPENVQKIAKTFGGVEHRIELVRNLDGVKYYNSSIDSSPARSTAALRSFPEPVIMIAGGYDKNLDYTGLGDEICQHVKTLILCGATSEKIRQAVNQSKLYRENAPKIIDAKTFQETVTIARSEAVSGDCVILSPASASFDLFKNFEERGRFFKELVNKLN